MADSGKGGGRGRGRGRGKKERQPADIAPGTPSSATSAKGNGRGRGRAAVTSPPQSPGEQGAAAAMETLAVEESGDVAAKPSTKPKSVVYEKMEQAMSRPGFGSKGRKIALLANHFPLKIPDKMKVYHYDLAVARKFKREKGKGKDTKPKVPIRRRADDDEDESVEDVIGEDGKFEIVLRRRTTWPKWLLKAIYSKLTSDPHFGLSQYQFKMAFDGAKNVFAQCVLPVPTGDGYHVTIQFPDEQRSDDFVVFMNCVAEVAVDLHEVFDRNLVERKSVSTLVLDVILRQSKMFSNVFISMGSRAFYAPPSPYNLGGGLWHYPGIWASVRPISGWKATVNLDMANTAFVKSGPLLGLLDDIARGWDRRALDPREIKSLERLVRGLKVDSVHRHDKRSARCVGVTRESARNLTFQCAVQSGGTAPLSVEKYFKMMFDKKEFIKPVQYPLLPCLHVGNKAKQNYVPIEFCEVKEGQRFNGKLNDQQTSAMLKAASTPAPDRKRKIEEEAKHFNFNRDPYLENFGLTFEMKMMSLNGRVLESPTIEHANNKTVAVRDGEWKLMGARVIKGATIRNWAVINTDQRTGGAAIENFCVRLMAEASRMGISFMTDQPLDYQEDDRADNIEPILTRMKEKAASAKGNLDLVFVVLSVKNSILYSSTKSAGDVVLGVNTQCVLGKNVVKADGALLANILLKINAKLGGVNNKLLDGSKQKIPQLFTQDAKTKKILWEPILILGADVNHPAPTDADGTPSVAAVVANVDMLPAQYAAKIMVQLRRQEPIAELQQAVQEMIYNFAQRNGRQLPRRIIMYRDGVGESMFLKVLTDELHAIQQACKKMGQYFKVEPYQPPITFIVVQKRHHTRLFCANSQDEKGRGRNVPPGTTVDSAIVHPVEFDFYLCSHLGLQGTSRPTHYHVLHDDSDFTADELQTLTYYVCHTYARALKSVSIPPPCYYADLVAYRARQYLTWKWPGASDSASTASGGSTVTLSELQKFVAVQDNITTKGMYFV